MNLNPQFDHLLIFMPPWYIFCIFNYLTHSIPCVCKTIPRQWPWSSGCDLRVHWTCKGQLKLPGIGHSGLRRWKTKQGSTGSNGDVFLGGLQSEISINQLFLNNYIHIINGPCILQVFKKVTIIAGVFPWYNCFIGKAKTFCQYTYLEHILWVKSGSFNFQLPSDLLSLRWETCCDDLSDLPLYSETLQRTSLARHEEAGMWPIKTTHVVTNASDGR